MNAPTPDDVAGIEWWNLLNEWGRRHWMARAGDTGWAIDAWTVFKHDAGGDLQDLQLLVDDALFGDDMEAQARLRALGSRLLGSGGVEALVALQGVLSDRAISYGLPGSRGGAIGGFWEHLPEWAAL